MMGQPDDHMYFTSTTLIIEEIFNTCLQTIITEYMYKTYIQTNNIYFRCLKCLSNLRAKSQNFLQINNLGT